MSRSTQTQPPLVTIGLPVYNGERYLVEALDSFLAQTFEDFEVVISDNGSTDSTPDIIRRYVEKDPRIRSFRSETNRGASWNFNRVVELATGTYFRWASHDDSIEPTYLERCVDVLESRPEVVLCATGVHVMDAAGQRTDYDRRPMAMGSPTPSERFEAWLRGADQCYEIFGLCRLDTLRSVPPLGHYGHADGVLLARLALLGPFDVVPDRLLNMRSHPEQSMSVYGKRNGKIDYRGWSEWFNPDVSGEMIFPYWRRFFEYARSPLTVRGTGLRTTMSCVVASSRWAIRQRRRLRGEVSFGVRVRVARLRPRGATGS